MLALAGAVLAFSYLPESGGKPVAWQDLSGELGPLEIVGLTRRTFETRKQFARFLERTAPGRAQPPIDFSRRQLLLVSPGPRSSTGYAVEVRSVRGHDGKIVVRVREQTPRLGDRVTAEVAYPYRLLSLPAGKDVYVDWEGR